MGDPAGYHWSIQSREPGWVWMIRDGEGAVVLAGDALTQAHAAACVVRAVVRAMTTTDAHVQAA